MLAFTLCEHVQVLFKQDPRLMDIRHWQRVAAKSGNTECDRIVVQKKRLLCRDGWQLNLTISWGKSIGPPCMGPQLADRAACVRVAHRFIWLGKHLTTRTTLLFLLRALAGHAQRRHHLQGETKRNRQISRRSTEHRQDSRSRLWVGPTCDIGRNQERS